MSNGSLDEPCWYVIQTHPRQENRAVSNLRGWNVPTYNPLLKVRRKSIYAREVSYAAKSLFPRYIFAKFSLTALYHKIRYTRGIHSLVAFGDYPMPVSQDLIDLIQSREDQEGFVRIGEELRAGDKLLIKEGPFRDFIGVLERKMTDSDRVLVLLETLRYQVRVIVEKESVRKLTAEDLD